MLSSGNIPEIHVHKPLILGFFTAIFHGIDYSASKVYLLNKQHTRIGLRPE